tara:strand:+ start:46 stop:870 length:825 start_codon:yes stop_codon:yes gene_type:complete
MLLYYLSKCKLGHYNIVFKNINELILFKNIYSLFISFENYCFSHQDEYSFEYNEYTIKCASCTKKIKTDCLISRYISNSRVENIPYKDIYLKPIVYSTINPELEKYIFFDMFNEICGFCIMEYNENYNNYMEELFKNTREVFDLLRPCNYCEIKKNDSLILDCNTFLNYYNITMNSNNVNNFYKWRHMIYLLFPRMNKIYVYDEIYSILYTRENNNISKEFNLFYLNTIIYKSQFMNIMYPYKYIYYGYILQCKIQNKKIENYDIIINSILSND